MERTIDQLRSMQCAPLSVKVRMTQTRIRQWIEEFGEDGVYLAFSGGKDSTVLAHIIDEMYPGNTIPKVHVATGLEYPELEEFCKGFTNLVVLRPKMTFKEVIKKKGYPLISKEVSETVCQTRKFIDKYIEKQTDDLPYKYRLSKPGVTEEDLNKAITNRQGWGDYIIDNEEPKLGHKVEILGSIRLMMLNGMYPKSGNGSKSAYNCEKYKFLLDAPFNVSNECCNIMKKYPSHKYAKETGRKVITAEMADESRLRTQQWLRNGCNGFNLKIPKSTPMSFWTEQDVLHYIKEHKVPICSVYGDIIPDNEEIEGQMEITDYIEPVGDEIKLKTTGCSRTGCTFCGFGCHLEKEGEGRFEMLRETHPKLYDYIMRPESKGGLNFKEVIDWTNEHGNLHIRY